MSGSRKKPKYIDVKASVGSEDYFGTIYDGMCRSRAYQALTIGEKQFYTMCRVQARSSHGRACLYKHGEECGVKYTDHDFVFPSSHLKMYGYDRGNGSKYFSALVAAGFIDIKEDNQHRKKVNVYSFSNRWKDTS